MTTPTAQTPDPDNLPVDPDQVEQTSEHTEHDQVTYRQTGDENDKQPARHQAPGDVGTDEQDQAGDDGTDDTDQDDDAGNG